MAIQWAQGFIAGHNIYTNASPPSSNAVPSKPAVLIPLLDSYCEAPPQSPLVAALINITKNLGGQQNDGRTAKQAGRKAQGTAQHSRITPRIAGEQQRHGRATPHPRLGPIRLPLSRHAVDVRSGRRGAGARKYSPDSSNSQGSAM